MFTGIIEGLGEIISNDYGFESSKLVIKASFNNIVAGESIAINGVCLTALPKSAYNLFFDVSKETLEATNLKNLSLGSLVNLERAVALNGRFGGHYVTGHVDTVAKVSSISLLQDYLELRLEFFVKDFQQYTPLKGSIAVNGVSLTINSLDANTITLMLVPHTLEHTNLKSIKIGELVNIEYDYYVKTIINYLNYKNAAGVL